ncbi:MAG TPA: 6-carboxytetrahydropterin synthase QueD [Elusimicrobia bacterium]|jgi:6-pyruvoyltetrahydropterin/6-carboxytetrahydropterin synthase|nr:6-carboxytetrahydropterin synthase QueD [Elusimicrobiota bacterium]
MFELSIQDHFSAAHNLRNYKGKCENLHGHNYRVQVFIRGEKLDKNGLLADFVELKKALKKVLDKLDHQYLNEVPPFTKLNPTAENIAKYIFEQLRYTLHVTRYTVSKVTVWESDTSSASYTE